MKDDSSRQLAEAQTAFAHTSGGQKPGGGGRFQYQRILVPLDFSRRSLRALKHAVSLAEPLRAKVSLLHVVVPDTHPLTHPVRQFHLPALLAESRSKLARLQAVLRRRGLDGEVVASVGLPFEQITAAARELQADLLVLTTHGRTGLKRLLVGSTAEMVLRNAPCPVLVLREGPAAATHQRAL
ncbi:MAG: universal stress protein [Verrucomicrobiota bacterium]